MNSVMGPAGRVLRKQIGWVRNDGFVSREHFVAGDAAKLESWIDGIAVRENTSHGEQGIETARDKQHSHWLQSQ